MKVWDFFSLSHTILSFRILGQPPLVEEDVLFSLLPCTEMYAISMVTFLTYNLTNLVQFQLMIWVFYRFLGAMLGPKEPKNFGNTYSLTADYPSGHPGFFSGAHLSVRQVPDFFVPNHRRICSIFALTKILFVSGFSAKLPDDVLPVQIFRLPQLCLGSFRLVIIPNYLPSLLLPSC